METLEELHNMDKILEERISILDRAIDEDDSDDDEIYAEVEVNSDDEVVELSGPDGQIPLSAIQTKLELEEVKEEPLEVSETEDNDLENAFDDVSVDEAELSENERYIGHQVETSDPTENLLSKDESFDVKEEKLDLSDLVLPLGWSVKMSKGKMAGRPLFTSPDGKYFHTVHTAMEHMMSNCFSQPDIATMKKNLKYDGWKEADYMPDNWLVVYSKATNAYHYLSPDCRLFKSAKAVTDFMMKNNYNPGIIDDIKKAMQDSKRFNSKIKFKWQDGGSSLPLGWKIRKAKGSGRHQTEVEFILSDDGIQFKTRFEALQHLISNNYSQDKIKVMRQKLLLSDEKWKESEFLPEGNVNMILMFSSNDWFFSRLVISIYRRQCWSDQV